jgi:cell filamentation protein
MKKISKRHSFSSKYSTTDIEFETGSKNRVLKNKLGIISIREMNDREIIEYVKGTKKLAEYFSFDHSFSHVDICLIHKTIFGNIYEWAGEYRNVEMSKDGFVFARAKYIPDLMKEFSKSLLQPQTPPNTNSSKDLSQILAKIHVEFILIHPFREGNGRTIRLLLSMIAQQAQYAGMDFGFIKDKGKEYKRYITAIQSGMKGNYELMEEIIEQALSR